MKPPYDRRFFVTHDEDGIPVGPSWDDFKIALQMWAWLVTSAKHTSGRDPTVSDAAVVFNVTNATVREAVGEMHLVFIDGPAGEPHKDIITFDGL